MTTPVCKLGPCGEHCELLASVNVWHQAPFHGHAGKVSAVCEGGSSYGLIGLPGLNLLERCVNDFARQGYERVYKSK